MFLMKNISFTKENTYFNANSIVLSSSHNQHDWNNNVLRWRRIVRSCDRWRFIWEDILRCWAWPILKGCFVRRILRCWSPYDVVICEHHNVRSIQNRVPIKFGLRYSANDRLKNVIPYISHLIIESHLNSNHIWPCIQIETIP